ENCAENFANRVALVGAEMARLDGRELEAERLYEQAIRAAREQGFVQNEGLAYELAARFYTARGFEAFADLYLRRARHCYQRWGADGKVWQLSELYPRLRENEPALDSGGTSSAPVEQLELATVLKVSQAVSGEMILDRLLDRLMRAAIEHAGAARGLLIARRGDALEIQAQATTSGADVTVNLRDSDDAEAALAQAGAERGLLLLPRGDELRLAAEATTRGDTVSVRLTDQSMAAAALPASIVQYVIRTQDRVLLDDAAAPNAFAADAALGTPHARSILCVPLLNQARLTGVLYLDNTLTPHVFTPSRSAVLTLLASQAAISLENARLYAERQRAE